MCFQSSIHKALYSTQTTCHTDHLKIHFKWTFVVAFNYPTYGYFFLLGNLKHKHGSGTSEVRKQVLCDNPVGLVKTRERVHSSYRGHTIRPWFMTQSTLPRAIKLRNQLSMIHKNQWIIIDCIDCNQWFSLIDIPGVEGSSPSWIFSFMYRDVWSICVFATPKSPACLVLDHCKVAKELQHIILKFRPFYFLNI